MVRVPVSLLKARMSEFIDRVKDGAELCVTEHRKPVARISPFARDAGGGNAGMAELVRAGIIRPGKGRIPAGLLRRSPVKLKGGGLLAALLDERNSGR